MAQKINQARPEGIPQPEIRPGDKWRDKTGALVSVTGYEHPCVFPVDRFLREYTRVETQTFTEWRATCGPLEKARKLRELIKARREGTQ